MMGLWASAWSEGLVCLEGEEDLEALNILGYSKGPLIV